MDEGFVDDTLSLKDMCQPNHSYADFMFCLHSDHTRAIAVAGVL